MGSSRTRGALGNLQGASISDRCDKGVGMGMKGKGRSDTRGRGHCQGGHRPTLLACGLSHNDLHNTCAAHHG